MAVTSTDIKNAINGLLRPLNVRLDTWTELDHEQARIEALLKRGALDSPVYALTGGMQRFDAESMTRAYSTFSADLNRLLDPAQNSVGYDPSNDYFRAADGSVLYLMIRSLAPRRVIEVGCGNSTRITRQAIRDGGLDTELVAVDPTPRVDIEGMVDRFEKRRLEETDISIFRELDAGDILFIDSSHEAFVGNDVAHLFCRVIPTLKPGVVIHVHDVFLPYEYPPNFAFAYPKWGEQYLAHALVFGRDCEILWPGYHVQRDRPELHERLPFVSMAVNQSFWFRWS